VALCGAGTDTPQIMPSNYKRASSYLLSMAVTGVELRVKNQHTLALVQTYPHVQRHTICLKTMDRNGKKLENQKLSFVTFVVTIFNSSYYTNENYWLNLC
jgi:hypothetical protein